MNNYPFARFLQLVFNYLASRFVNLGDDYVDWYPYSISE